MNFWQPFNLRWAYKAIFFCILALTAYSFAQNKWMKAFNHPSPQSLYTSQYTFFEWMSSSTLFLASSPQTLKFEAHSTLLFNFSTPGSLERKSFIDESPLLLRFNRSTVHIKMPWQGIYQQTAINSEIQTWLQVPFEEIFDLFEQAEFDEHFDEKPQEVSSKRTCFKEKRGFLCFDSQTQLPIEGQLSLRLSGTSHIQTRFLITIFKNPQKLAPKN